MRGPSLVVVKTGQITMYAPASGRGDDDDDDGDRRRGAGCEVSVHNAGTTFVHPEGAHNFVNHGSRGRRDGYRERDPASSTSCWRPPHGRRSTSHRPGRLSGVGAAQRQKLAWIDLDPGLVAVRLRPVSVNPETGEEVEKGIDVALACSAVEHVLMDHCDVAIIFSHDSDLLPPVETICRLRGREHIETASWQSDLYRKRIPPAKQSWGTPFGVVNHTLKVELFDSAETPVDFTEDL
jgi:hypothetical protein